MKISDLREKKGPIIGAPKGSQQDSRLSPGTDDPSKYMRGGEWEAYREPQGVNSDAGKIAGGRKKGTTKTKNKKTSESVYSDKTKFKYKWEPALLPDPDGAPSIASFEAPKKGEDGIKHIIRFGVRDEMKGKAHKKDNRKRQTKEGIGDDLRAMRDNFFGKENQKIRALKQNPEYGHKKGNEYIRAAIDWARENKLGEVMDRFMDARVQFARHMSRGEYENALSMLTYVGNTRAKFYQDLISNESVIPSGGPGASGDLVPRDPHATTIAMVKDTLAPNVKKSPKLAGSEAPTKFVKKQIKKSLDNRPGNISDVTESLSAQVDSILNEAIPRVTPKEYNADYDLMDDSGQELIGVARISQGVIELLSVRNDLVEDFNGHIMSRLMSTIVRDADSANVNLAIALDDPSNLQQKRFLERYGFRAVGESVMKRNAGSVTPPSVPTAKL